MVAIAADIDRDNYRVFLAEHDIDRTLRIYKALAELSDEAVSALNSGQSKEFSLITDRMRPLMAYTSDNNVKISSFLDENSIGNAELMKKDPNVRVYITKLAKNLKIIEKVRLTMAEVPFNPVFFLSEDLTNAFLDYKFELAWDFELDMVLLLNLDDIRLIDTLVGRGQRRFLLVGGSIDPKDCHSVINTGGHLLKLDTVKPLMEAGGLPAFPGRPPHRFLILDVGEKSVSEKKKADILMHISNERNNMWARFNTVNRADATRVLNNLGNMSVYDQATIFKGKFKDRAAVIVCPGPSLKKNVELLKKIKGKALIICVLHALKELQARGIDPDVVVHVDPADLKKLYSKKDGQEISHWDSWIGDQDFSHIPYLVVSNYSAPNMFEAPFKNILWMSPGLPIGELLPVKTTNFERVGGSVSHSAFDLAVEWGCSSVALIGQDLATSKEGDIYSSEAAFGFDEEEKQREKMKVYGADVEVKGFDQKTKVMSNNTFVAFAKSYSIFAKDLKKTGIKLYNCTEGGMFIKGFKHTTFKEFIDIITEETHQVGIEQIINENVSTSSEIKERKNKTKKFLGSNSLLSNEISKLIETVLKITEKTYHSEEDLQKFDRFQNRLIKKMKKNMFFSLGLQRDIHILQAGLKADPSIRGQLGFHKDFLEVARNLNNKFVRTYKAQRQLVNTH